MMAAQAMEAIHALPRLPKGGASLTRMENLLEELGHPESGLRFVHIAGTNGKGTVASLTAAILKEAGYRTGLTISPYVLEFRERFQINGEMIPARTLTALISQVLDAAERMKAAGREQPVEFEAVTAVALLWFARERCDVVVMETGLGGRFDATNAAVDENNLLVSVITKIGLDHTDLLGDTLAKIAAEKAGIFKQGRPVVCYPEQPKEALGELLSAAAEKNCPWICPDGEDLEFRKARRLENFIDYGGYQAILSYPGRHQALNAVVAVETALTLWRECGLEIPDEAILAGLRSKTLPARIEVLCRYPVMILDGSHNPDGGHALAETLSDAGFTDEKLVGVIGMMKDKNVEEYLSALENTFYKVFTVQPDNPRSMSAEELAELAKYHFDATPCKSLKEALRLAEKENENTDGEGIVVCGSLYLAAQARPLLQKLAGD